MRKSRVPRFRMFAGPNGSGKTTLVQIVQSRYHIGAFVNADIILQHLNRQPFIDLSSTFQLPGIAQEDLDTFAANYDHIEKRIKKSFEAFPLSIRSEFVVRDTGKSLSSYDVAFLADFLNTALLKHSRDFSYETVMSHPSKVALLRNARDHHFKTYLYYINTVDPLINISRVQNRKQKGGHDVSEKKIRDRYFRSLDNLYDAVEMADRAFILDSSNQSPQLIAEKKNNGQLVFSDENIPWWVEAYLKSKLGDGER